MSHPQNVQEDNEGNNHHHRPAFWLNNVALLVVRKILLGSTLSVNSFQ